MNILPFFQIFHPRQMKSVVNQLVHGFTCGGGGGGFSRAPGTKRRQRMGFTVLRYGCFLGRGVRVSNLEPSSTSRIALKISQDGHQRGSNPMKFTGCHQMQ